MPVIHLCKTMTLRDTTEVTNSPILTNWEHSYKQSNCNRRRGGGGERWSILKYVSYKAIHPEDRRKKKNKKRKKKKYSDFIFHLILVTFQDADCTAALKCHTLATPRQTAVQGSLSSFKKHTSANLHWHSKVSQCLTNPWTSFLSQCLWQPTVLYCDLHIYIVTYISSWISSHISQFFFRQFKTNINIIIRIQAKLFSIYLNIKIILSTLL